MVARLKLEGIDKMGPPGVEPTGKKDSTRDAHQVLALPWPPLPPSHKGHDCTRTCAFLKQFKYNDTNTFVV